MRNRLTLPDSPYDARVTDLALPVRPPNAVSSFDGFENRNGTSTIVLQLVGGAVAVRVLPRNPRRSGLRIQNKDAAADLLYSLGNDQAANGIIVPPRGSDLYDFTTPPDELYLFSSANITVIVVEMTRLPAPPKARISRK